MTDTTDPPMIQAETRGTAASVLPSAVQVRESLALVIFDSAGAHGRMYAGDRVAGHANHHRADFNVMESYSILSEALAIVGEGCRPKGKCLMTGVGFGRETGEQKARPTP